MTPPGCYVSAISQINATQFTADLLDMSSAAST